MVYKITDPKFIKLVEKGVPLAELEKRLKPGTSSTIGFIGKDESLLELIHSDWKTLDHYKKTHTDIANLVAQCKVNSGYEVLQLATTPGAQDCPWGCSVKGRNTGLLIESGLPQMTKEGLQILASYEGSLSKLEEFCKKYSKSPDLNKMLEEVKEYLTNQRAYVILTNLLPHLISGHYFFEGKQSPYRADPEILIKAFSLEGKK